MKSGYILSGQSIRNRDEMCKACQKKRGVGGMRNAKVLVDFTV